MKRLILFLLLSAAFASSQVLANTRSPSQVFWDGEDGGNDYVVAVFEDQALTASGGASPTATSSAIQCLGQYYGVWYKCVGDGSPDVTIEVLMSYDSTAANFVEPDGMPDIVTNLATETAHVESVSPPPMRFMKIKLTNGDSAAVTCSLYLVVN